MYRRQLRSGEEVRWNPPDPHAAARAIRDSPFTTAESMTDAARGLFAVDGEDGFRDIQRRYLELETDTPEGLPRRRGEPFIDEPPPVARRDTDPEDALPDFSSPDTPHRLVDETGEQEDSA